MSNPIEPFYRDFGGLVQEARKRKKLSQAQLGQRLSLTRASVANIENAKQRVLGHTLLELAALLDLPLSDLMRRTRATEDSGSDVESELSQKLGISPQDARKLLENVK